jgi:hypothetical protein
LEGVTLDESEQYCTMKIPEYCWYDLFDGMMDASKLRDCTSHSGIDPEWRVNL